jgi:uncharacterized repeat protein (TIGR03803 family)
MTLPAARLASAQKFRALIDFSGANAANPTASLAQGLDGNLYGAILGGGAYDPYGTIFRITPWGALSTLYSFCGQMNCPDGEWPYSGLVLAADGNFYGTTELGGANGYGTAFRVTPTGTLTTLHSFCYSGCTEGVYPYADLIQASDGSLYGTTQNGGTTGYNAGTVFRISPAGVLTTLYSFCAQSNCADGELPYAGLAQATNGSLYGTTSKGGTTRSGTIFKLTLNGTLTTLYTFCSRSNCDDGSDPTAGLVQAADGNLYGTTYSGGTNNSGTISESHPQAR